MDHRDQSVSCCIVKETCNELAEATPEGDKGKKDCWRLFITPPLSHIGCSDPCWTCKACQAERCRRCNGLKEYCNIGITLKHALNFLILIGLERHYGRVLNEVQKAGENKSILLKLTYQDHRGSPQEFILPQVKRHRIPTSPLQTCLRDKCWLNNESIQSQNSKIEPKDKIVKFQAGTTVDPGILIIHHILNGSNGRDGN